jgi:hypothetical protein
LLRFVFVLEVIRSTSSRSLKRNNERSNLGGKDSFKLRLIYTGGHPLVVRRITSGPSDISF